MRTTRRVAVSAAVSGAGLLLVAAAAVWTRVAPAPDPGTASGPRAAGTSSPAEADTHPHPSFLFGRVTTGDGVTYEGRLRWGGTEEAFWGDYFNGFKAENPWVAHVPTERRPTERRKTRILGFEFGEREIALDLGRPFMARFGDIASIEARDSHIRVTLKSGTAFDLDRFAADDLADGLRVWDRARGVVDFTERRIRTIELLATPSHGAAPHRLHGTVRTPAGDFNGFVQWNREKGLGTDTLDGRTDGGRVSVPFDTVRSIVRGPGDGCRVTRIDGHEMLLSGTRETGRGHRGLYVDDPRYGRVLISWNAFERVDFSPGDSGPSYDDFPPGSPLSGSVTTRAGHVLSGRLVYDLDESETTETLDAPAAGVHYTIPFGLIASIAPPPPDDGDDGRARVTLHRGEELWLESAGDVGEKNAGMLVFVDDHEQPEFVTWNDVERVDLARPPVMYP